MNHPWTQFQEETLRGRAFAERDFLGLSVYYAARRNRDALEALAPALENASPSTRLAHRLLLGELPADTAAVLGEGAGPWLHYTAAKALLGAGRVKDALDVAMSALESGDTGVSAINLIATFLQAHGEASAARDLAEISLQLHPGQADVAEIRDGLEESKPRHLYLEPRPWAASITFYIPAFNVEDYIRGAIEGLAAQTCPIAEVLVVDDCGHDRSIEIAGAYPVRIVAHPENRGLAAARNTAFRQSSSEWVGAIDTDAHPDPVYLQHAWMELENAGPKMAGVGGRLIETHRETPADLFRALHLGQDLGRHRCCPPAFLFGANTVFRRSPVLEVGGYGEEFRANAEDHDMGRKLREAGHTFVFSPLLIARHQRRDTPASVLRTLWGWSYHEKLQRGLLDSWERIAAMGRANVHEAVKLMNADLEAGHPKAVYVDFLFIFHDTFHNLRYAGERGMIAGAARAGLQRALLDSVRDLDTRFGGDLYAKMRRDSLALLDGEDAEEMPSGPLAAWLSDMQEELGGLYDALPEEVYHFLAA